VPLSEVHVACGRGGPVVVADSTAAPPLPIQRLCKTLLVVRILPH